MCSRSMYSSICWYEIQRQPWLAISWPSARNASTTAGLRASAMPTPNTVSGSWRSRNSRRIRHTPAREPYSYSDSIDMCRAGNGCAADDLGQEGLGRRVAVQHAVLAAFLVVQHELDGDARAAGPVRMRRRRAVAREVARIAGLERRAASSSGGARAARLQRAARWRDRSGAPTAWSSASRASHASRCARIRRTARRSSLRGHRVDQLQVLVGRARGLAARHVQRGHQQRLRDEFVARSAAITGLRASATRRRWNSPDSRIQLRTSPAWKAPSSCSTSARRLSSCRGAARAIAAGQRRAFDHPPRLEHRARLVRRGTRDRSRRGWA